MRLLFYSTYGFAVRSAVCSVRVRLGSLVHSFLGRGRILADGCRVRSPRTTAQLHSYNVRAADGMDLQVRGQAWGLFG